MRHWPQIKYIGELLDLLISGQPENNGGQSSRRIKLKNVELFVDQDGFDAIKVQEDFLKE